MNQPKTIDLSAIPNDHIPLVLNSLLCEEMLNFTRALDKATGEWVWTGKSQDGEETHELFDFVREDSVALEMLSRFCRNNSWGYQINMIPDLPEREVRSHFKVYLLRKRHDNSAEVFAESTATRLGSGIAVIVAQQLGVDVVQRHRELYPAHYIAANH